MKICLYARQGCKWPDEGCPREEELRPIFASKPEVAVREVWGCQWSGTRVTAAEYLMQLLEKEKVRR